MVAAQGVQSQKYSGSTVEIWRVPSGSIRKSDPSPRERNRAEHAGLKHLLTITAPVHRMMINADVAPSASSGECSGFQEAATHPVAHTSQPISGAPVASYLHLLKSKK